MSRTIAIAAAVVLLFVVAIRYASPIQDGDLFWHMAYAKQMLARHTLILDHSTFSWTPSQTPMIYCAWLSELAFYWLWEHAGMASLFVLRYVAVALVIGLAAYNARRRGVLGQELSWLVLLILVLGSVAGAFLKPEIFSLVFFNLVVAAYFQYRIDGSIRWLYAVPMIVLIWANSHGGFVMAAPFLAATAIGEAFRNQPIRQYRHLLIAWGLCIVAAMLTPYGARYPLQLISDLIFQQTSRPDAAWNAANQSIISPTALGFHFVDLMALMLVLLTVGCAFRMIDWPVVLMNLFYIPLYFTILRTTFFWPAVFAYSMFLLLDRKPAMRRPPAWMLRTATAVVFLFMAGRAVVEARNRPDWGGWLGFGIGHVNPVPEAEFLAAHAFPPKIYNFFDSGGYLLWRLHPRYEVMVDSRSFPYLSWTPEEHAFERGEIFEEFLARHPAEVAVVDLLHQAAWANFLHSRDWRPVFYGPTAAVFLKRTVAYEGDLRAETGGLRSAQAGFFVFDFACATGDFRTAWDVLRRLETDLHAQTRPGPLRAAQAYRDAQAALQAGDWRRAKSLLASSSQRRLSGDRDRLIAVFLDNLEKRQGGNPDVYLAALKKLAAPLPQVNR